MFFVYECFGLKVCEMVQASWQEVMESSLFKKIYTLKLGALDQSIE